MARRGVIGVQVYPSLIHWLRDEANKAVLLTTHSVSCTAFWNHIYSSISSRRGVTPQYIGCEYFYETLFAGNG